jgi:hypothetical protein
MKKEISTQKKMNINNSSPTISHLRPFNLQVELKMLEVKQLVDHRIINNPKANLAIRTTCPAQIGNNKTSETKIATWDRDEDKLLEMLKPQTKVL